MESQLELLVQDSRSTDNGDALSALNSDASSVSQSELASSNAVSAVSWADDDGALLLYSASYQY